jgi:hypothetical protein
MGTEICIFKNKLFADALFLHIVGMSLSFRYLSISSTCMKQITLIKWKCLGKKERKKEGD